MSVRPNKPDNLRIVKKIFFLMGNYLQGAYFYMKISVKFAICFSNEGQEGREKLKDNYEGWH